MRPGNNKKEKNGQMKFLAFTLALLLCFLLFSSIVSAQGIGNRIKGSFSNMGSRMSNSKIGNYFSNYAQTTGPTFLDFFIFFVIFFSLNYIGFKQFFKDAGKGPVVGLSIALGIALSAALVYGGKVTFKKMLPFALVILALGIVILVYSLLSKYMFKSDSTGSKVAAFLIAVIIAVILIYLLVSMICFQNRCNNSPILSKLFGPHSFFGKIGSGLKSASGTSKTTATQTSPQKTPGEKPSGPPIEEGGAVAQNATAAGTAYEPEPPSWNSYLHGGVASALLIIMVIGLLVIRKRQSGRDAPEEEKIERKERKSLKRFLKFLEDMISSQEKRKEDSKKVKTELQKEGSGFSKEAHIVDELKTDIKDTVGEELNKIKWAQEEGLDFDNLHRSNKVEKKHVEKIISDIKDDISRIGELEEGLEDLNRVVETYESAGETMGEAAEKMQTLNIGTEENNKVSKQDVARLKQELKELGDSFKNFSEYCKNSMDELESQSKNLSDFKKGKGFSSYQELVQKVMDLKTSFAHLNQLFSQKVALFKRIAEELNIIDADLRKVELDEMSKLTKFSDIMVDSYRKKRFDRCLHFAEILKKNTEAYIEHEKKTKKEKEALGDWKGEDEERLTELLKLKHRADQYLKAAESMYNPDIAKHIAEQLRDCKDKKDPKEIEKDLRAVEQKLAYALERSDDAHKDVFNTLKSLEELVKKDREMLSEVNKLNKKDFKTKRIKKYMDAFSMIKEEEIDNIRSSLPGIEVPENDESRETIDLMKTILGNLSNIHESALSDFQEALSDIEEKPGDVIGEMEFSIKQAKDAGREDWVEALETLKEMIKPALKRYTGISFKDRGLMKEEPSEPKETPRPGGVQNQ